MHVLRWLRSRWSISKTRLNKRGFLSARQEKPSIRPRAELLEDRLAPALFSPPPPPALPSQPTDGNRPMGVWVADFNGDGGPDIAVTNFATGNLSVGLGNGDGNFHRAIGSPFMVGGSAGAVTAADFN